MHAINDLSTSKILNHLACPRQAPTLRYLNRLIAAYTRAVPWESVSRIVKRRATPAVEDCPRLPEEFWRDALTFGCGGTCYESSLAFYSLLLSLGFAGYLTVNDMGETRGCHAAITILLDGQKYLVDVTIPVCAAVQIHPARITRRRTPLYNYALHPVRDSVYEVTRTPHPRRGAFTLIDRPVSLPDYHVILQNDYRETGYFNHCVVMNKVLNGATTRFFSDNQPYRLERFDRQGKLETPLPIDTLPCTLAETFGISAAKIAEALAYIQATTAIRPH